jgi:O-methyltransferase
MRASYLELLKLCLCDLIGPSTRTVSRTGDGRLFSRRLTGDEQMGWRVVGSDWPLNALTMVGLKRLDDLQGCVECVVNDRVEGDVIEAGSWRGGASIFVRATLDAFGDEDRTVWVADSFQGFPVPEADGIEEDRELETDLTGIDFFAPSLEEVKGNFARFGCEQGVRFLPGFFEETMQQVRDRRWSIVRLDGDTYKATWLTLEALYPDLSLGGYLIIDDYAFLLPGCRRAVDEFRREHEITEPIERIDWSGARWRRERETPCLAGDTGSSPAPRRRNAARAVAERAESRIPTARELVLGERVEELEARLEAAKSQLDRLRSSPFAGPSAWWARRREHAVGPPR